MSARDRQRGSALTALGIGDVQELILREAWMDGDEVQGVPTFAWRCGRSPQRFRRENAIANHPQVTVALGYENSSRVDERQTPGMEQATGNRHNADLAALHIEH